MGLIVQKYGGTSVGDLERIRRVVDRVKATVEAGNQVVVVLSAMAGVTDSLISLAKELDPHPDPRELDVLMATGEQQSVALFCIAARVAGLKARSLLGFQVPIYTEPMHTRARITEVGTQRIRKLLEQGYAVVIAGFQGMVAESGDITTLGRGGSDTTAVAVAAALGADVCEIYTDVEGVFTADPNIVPGARKLEAISYEEMLEMASAGAKVLEIRSVEFAMRFGVKIHVRSSFTDREGTMVMDEQYIKEKLRVSGVTYSKNEARITVRDVPDQPGVAAKIFTPISEAGIVVDMIVQNTSAEGRTDLSFTVPRTDYDQTMRILEPVAKEVGAGEVLGETSIAKVSIVGVGMRTHAGVAAKMFSTLADHGINIEMITTSEIKISCVIQEKYTELAVRVLHEAFGLEQPAVAED